MAFEEVLGCSGVGISGHDYCAVKPENYLVEVDPMPENGKCLSS